MSKFKVISSFLVFFTFIFTTSVFAGNNKDNTKLQPQWGPASYTYASYYYLPAQELYYSVNKKVFYYSENGKWKSAKNLPAKYKNVDLYSAYKVVINDNSAPYKQHDKYKKQYANYASKKQVNRKDNEAKKPTNNASVNNKKAAAPANANGNSNGNKRK